MVNHVCSIGYVARAISDHLIASTGIVIVFESAIVPKWKDSRISFKNVYITRRPEVVTRSRADKNTGHQHARGYDVSNHPANHGFDDDDDAIEQDEDAALAAALAMSAGGGAYQGDENLEAQVLACRCLANLMEALPGVAHTVVYHGAIPVLCSKLIEISYIDLA